MRPKACPLPSDLFQLFGCWSKQTVQELKPTYFWDIKNREILTTIHSGSLYPDSLHSLDFTQARRVIRKKLLKIEARMKKGLIPNLVQNSA